MYSHKHKQVLVELGIDLSKEALMQFEADNGDKVVFALHQLILNLSIADKFDVINPSEEEEEAVLLDGKHSGKVPTNMTAICIYISGLNP